MWRTRPASGSISTAEVGQRGQRGSAQLRGGTGDRTDAGQRTPWASPASSAGQPPVNTLKQGARGPGAAVFRGRARSLAPGRYGPRAVLAPQPFHRLVGERLLEDG